ncbi:hypothetical protein N0B51_00410 [Tsuneonella sp. YG55]|uniref:Uncharacterized protein n=1 Tax=Tsuneonella litorea TaxID=2976475 RepID=A0A9X3ALS6_9SPHN|nr:hypothetical protein [Tsuneonella litorea]MCT2557432.1 hypothetical protein [Tsuneonella litorea]
MLYRLIPVALLGALATAAAAHPTNVRYETRGQCEVAFAESSKLDRERIVDLGFFPTIGAAQRTFRDTFECRYDAERDGWYIVDLRGR